MEIVIIKNRRRIAVSEKAITFSWGIGNKRIFNIPRSQILKIEETEDNKTKYFITEWIYKIIKDNL